MNKLSNEEKLKSFQNELNAIKNETIRDFTSNMITELIPDYFWEVAAASTGKYHPPYAQGEGGLYRHTIAATRIAIGLFPLVPFSDFEKDTIIAALIMHDSFKHGKTQERYTRADHPVIASKAVLEYADSFDSEKHNEIALDVSNLILTHMGQWNTDYRTKKEIMPKPRNALESFVHQCDYLASRKYLEFNFEEVVKRD